MMRKSTTFLTFVLHIQHRRVLRFEIGKYIKFYIARDRPTNALYPNIDDVAVAIWGRQIWICT